MLTTDSIYFKPLLPVITIKNTANNSTLYTYNSFTDSGTTDKVLYCSVNLSQNTHGEFVIQFEDQNKSLESTVTVGSRVQIDCGKQSSSLTRLISGLVRKKGYSRGADSKVLYTIQGTSTGIRLNERVTYVVSEAAKLGTGQYDKTDVSRKADTLLAANLNALTADGILSISNLAANSDVETFIASLTIEYGEFQDMVNYIEDQSGGEVVIDTNDLVNFRYEIKNNLSGRGFTIKNSNANKGNDDADDTMYLRGKNWSYEEDFYKSANYANRIYSILPAETVPSTREELGFTSAGQSSDVIPTQELAAKFRPPHSRFLPSDIIIVGGQSAELGGLGAEGALTIRFRICNDSGGLPQNAGGVIVNMDFLPDQFDNPIQLKVGGVEKPEVYKVLSQQIFYNSTNTRIDEFFLDTTKDYWLIASNTNFVSGYPNWFHWGRDPTISGTMAIHGGSGYSTNSAGGSGWTVFTGIGNKLCFDMPRRRSHSFVMWDPKAMQAVQSGLTAGLATDSVLSDLSSQVKTKESMYRHLSGQLYNMVRPRTIYNFPAVMAPNIPPFPGDPIVISDTILGLSTAGNQVILSTCGDMTYQWGNMGTGSYEAPTKLNIQAIAVPPRYR